MIPSSIHVNPITALVAVVGLLHSLQAAGRSSMPTV